MNLQRYFHLFRSHRSLRATIARQDLVVRSLRSSLADCSARNKELTDRLTLANHLIFKQETELAAAEAQVKAANAAGEIVAANYQDLQRDFNHLLDAIGPGTTP